MYSLDRLLERNFILIFQFEVASQRCPSFSGFQSTVFFAFFLLSFMRDSPPSAVCTALQCLRYLFHLRCSQIEDVLSMASESTLNRPSDPFQKSCTASLSIRRCAHWDFRCGTPTMYFSSLTSLAFPSTVAPTVHVHPERTPECLPHTDLSVAEVWVLTSRPVLVRSPKPTAC